MSRNLLVAVNRACLNEAALLYARCGWPVFPLHHPVGTACSCTKSGCERAGKHPRTAHGLKDATTDPAQLQVWWEHFPDANIGLVTGPRSGVFVVDVDTAKGGLESWARLVAEFGDVTTLQARTGSGGLHVFFRYPTDDLVIRNKQGLRPGIDVRGDGGYVVVAPSRHVSGRCYQWLI